MLPHRSTLVLVTCVTCLSFASSLGKGANLCEPASANSQVMSSISLKIAQAKPVASEPPVLNLGSRGPEVTQLQTQLKQLGYYNEAVDGVYGESTASAVSKFQKSVGLKGDGIAGSTTWNRLQTPQSENKPSSPPSPKAQPKEPAKSPSGRIKTIWLIAGFVVLAAGVGGVLFFWLRRFGKETYEVEPDLKAESNSLSNDSSSFESRNGGTTETGIASDKHNLDSSKNGYTGEPGQATNEESSLLPFAAHTLLPASHLSPSSPSESTEETPTDEAAIEKTTRLPRIDIVDELIKDLQSAEPAKRRKAIWELAQRGDSRAIQPLVDLIIDSDSQQRGLILEAVSQIGVRTLKPMNRALAVSLQDENAQVRKNAIRDLTRVYEMITQINYLLRHAMDDPDGEVKETGKWALEQLNRVRSSSGIDNLSASPNPEISSDEPPKEPEQ